MIPTPTLLEANAKKLHQTGRAFIMRDVLLYFSDFAGGLNGSTQHSARTHLALKTKAKIAR